MERSSAKNNLSFLAFCKYLRKGWWIFWIIIARFNPKKATFVTLFVRSVNIHCESGRSKNNDQYKECSINVWLIIVLVLWNNLGVFTCLNSFGKMWILFLRHQISQTKWEKIFHQNFQNKWNLIIYSFFGGPNDAFPILRQPSHAGKECKQFKQT